MSRGFLCLLRIPIVVNNCVISGHLLTVIGINIVNRAVVKLETPLHTHYDNAR